MKKNAIYRLLFVLSVVVALNACSPSGGNNTGHEYMPDMAHSIAYEANYYNYYSLNTWGEEEDYKKYAMPRTPVDGTVPRGYAGNNKDNEASLSGSLTHSGMSVPVNGSRPYYYEDTEDERTRATSEIIDNPFPITDKELVAAKELYNVYCGICHGDKGDGSGYLVRDDGGVYPAQPANFLTDEFVSASNGRYYHAIVYGKNVMGGYTDKLSFEERWQVIHYIRSLQAKDKGLAYNENENTLNNVDVPASSIEVATHVTDEGNDVDGGAHDAEENNNHGNH
jgi:hypothetical protein